ncbi:MAG: hypothetical protein K6E10_11335, partial [Eubacterium sp.]|nr:hypothetical protein [Eubacterium sp.]
AGYACDGMAAGTEKAEKEKVFYEGFFSEFRVQADIIYAAYSVSYKHKHFGCACGYGGEAVN